MLLRRMKNVVRLCCFLTVVAAMAAIARGQCPGGTCPPATFQRRPTPPMSGPEPYIEPAGPLVPVQAVVERTGAARKPMLPWRGEAEQRDKAQSDSIDKLIELERLRSGRDAWPPSVVVQPPASTVKPTKPASDRSPLLAGLGIFAGVAVGFVVYFATQKS